MRGITGKRVGYVEPGSHEWLQYMTASKIAAVVGHSPYDSRFSLWHIMNGTVPPKPGNDETKRGTILEPAIAAWWAEQHPEARLFKSAMYQHPQFPWAAASPDRIIRYGNGTDRPEVLECKSAANPWEWGEEGTDEIPPYYYDQAQWQAGVLGLDTVRVAALMSGLQFKEYVVHFDSAYFARLLGEGREFMKSLWAGEKPTIDGLEGHAETYRAIRYLHPDIDLEEVEVPFRLALAAQDAVLDKESLERRTELLKIQFTDLMGTAKYAVHEGHKIAGRQARGDGDPYVVFPPSLKKVDFTDIMHNQLTTITEGAA